MKSVVLFFLACVAMHTSAQRTLHISYDKANDAWSYFQVKMVEGKTEKVPLNKRLPKLKETDIVQVEVVNYNPFLYYVDIRQEDHIVETGGSSGITGIVNLLSGGLPLLAGLESGVLGGATRGSDAEAVDASNQTELSLYRKEAQMMVTELKGFNERYMKFQHAIQLLESENLAIIKEEVLNELEACKKDYYNPELQLSEYYPSMQLHYLKAGINDDRYKEQMAEVSKQIQEFKEQLVALETIYTKEAIQEIIRELKTTSFSQQAKFQMGKYEQFSAVTDGDELAKNEVLFGKRFVLNFYNRNDLKSKSEEQSNGYGEPTFVRYYWPNRYWTPKGELVNEKCVGCQPVVAAEGLYDGTPPRNLFALWDDVNGDKDEDWREHKPLRDEAIKDWVFYDTNGVVDYISVAPAYEEDLTTAWEKEFSKTYDSDDLENKPHQRRMVELPVNGGFNVGWTSGFYAVGAFGPRYKYSLSSNATMDSVQLNGTTSSSILPCIGSQMDFQFFGNKTITPTVNLGAAVDFWNEREIHFLLGGGLRFKAFPYLGLSAGLSFTRMQLLNDQVRIGDMLEGSESDYLDSDSDSIKTINGTPLVEKKYRPGYYFGINITF
jgi:hypothetical protein